MDIALSDMALVALVAFGAQVLGGVAGYGTGLTMPLILVPLIGADAVVPVIALASIITNPTRLITFWSDLDRRKAVIVSLAAAPTVMLGAFAFSLLTGQQAQIFIGAMLVCLVPMRHAMRKLRFALSDRGLAVSSLGYGLVMGGTSGSGVMLLSMLMAAGLSSKAVIATDAAVSTFLGLFKTGVFLGAGVLPPSLWAVAILIGLMATPGALVAKWLTTRISARSHDLIFDAAIMTGGLVLLVPALLGDG
ncbi:MAG: sulfite exporter TauE/SafE family protein [Rhodospirillales bacterium]